ncbi:MAG TPA: hotdog fold thioesterase [Ferruginibacter sp.]|nr:hotdog fold thioesterase [Ferruginibacter sp.]
MSIWFNKNLVLPDISTLEYGRKTMAYYLGMEWVELGDDYLVMRMPVNERTIQPYGLLHGGASCALAETVGSLASHFVINAKEKYCVGLEINANHVRSATSGFVTATCTALHLGSSTHVWDIKIHDDNKKLVCVSRLTVAILEKKKK